MQQLITSAGFGLVIFTRISADADIMLAAAGIQVVTRGLIWTPGVPNSAELSVPDRLRICSQEPRTPRPQALMHVPRHWSHFFNNLTLHTYYPIYREE